MRLFSGKKLGKSFYKADFLLLKLFAFIRFPYLAYA